MCIRDSIAKQYSVSAASLHRHKDGHLPAKLVKAQEAREIAKADSPVSYTHLDVYKRQEAKIARGKAKLMPLSV